VVDDGGAIRARCVLEDDPIADSRRFCILKLCAKFPGKLSTAGT
jgi:hypothetical protein